MGNIGNRPHGRRAHGVMRGGMAAFVTACLCLAPAACGREPSGLGEAAGIARIEVQAFQSADTGRGDINAVVFTIYVLNAPGSALRRRELRSLSFNPETDPRFKQDSTQQSEGSITLEFLLQGAGSVYEVEGKAMKDALVLFEIPTATFTEAQASVPGGAKVSATPRYVGPGAGATRLVIGPSTMKLKPGETGTFTAQAFTSENVPVANVPIRWYSSNPGVAFMENSSAGVVRAGQQGGTAMITAAFEQLGLSATATVIVELTPTAVAVLSGNGQTAQAGQQLAQPVRVRVMSGAVPVPGAGVTFSAGSGSVSPATVLTNAQGEAETRWTLGPTAGTQTLTVGVAGVPNATVTATAIAPQVNVAIFSTNPTAICTTGSSSIVAEVRVNGVPTSGQQVSFSLPGTAGAMSPTSAVTNANGQASSVFMSTTPGGYVISASAQGVTAQTLVTVVETTTGMSVLLKVSGDNQTVRQGQPFAQPMVVRAVGHAGGPVCDVPVAFTFSSSGQTGPIVLKTDVTGQVIVTFTAAPGVTGVGTVVATVGQFSVTFTFTATP